MKEYEKTRIARLFDDSVSAKNTTGEHIVGSDKNIPLEQIHPLVGIITADFQTIS